MAKPTEYVVLSCRCPVDLAKEIDRIADVMGITRSDMMHRALRNGVEDLGKITELAAHPVINLALKLAAKFAVDDDELDEIERALNHLNRHRSDKNQQTLDGIVQA